ncbi:ABC transporter substrate-binding protein [soil metagenome]
MILRKWSRIGIALTAAAGLVAVAGCTSGPSKENSSVKELSVMTRWLTGTPEGTIQAEVFAKFTKDTGVKINVTQGGKELGDQLETATVAGKGPDIAIINLFNKSTQWLNAGLTVPVDQYVKDWGLDGKFQDDALVQWRNGATPSGKLQGFPYSGFTWPVWYNMSLLQKAGITEIPATTDDLIADAQKLRAAGIGPLIVGGKDFSGQKLFYQIIQMYSTAKESQKVMAKGGYCSTPDVMKGIELFTKLRDAGVFVDNSQGYSVDDMTSTFFAQKAAMMSALSNNFGPAAKSGTDVVKNVKLGGFPLASGSSFSKPTEYKGFTGSGFMITKKGASSGHIELVKKLITAFMAKDVVGQFVTQANNVTPLKADFSDAATDSLLKSSLSMDSGLDAAVLPDLWLGAAADPVTQSTGLAFGKVSASDICKSLDAATK